jgi:predicted GIY-YIG superfamily endonuclease/DNA-binding XRE family transcriptional regulator
MQPERVHPAMERQPLMYRYYAEDGTLLYLGVTRNVWSRDRSHRTKPWYAEVARRVDQNFLSIAEALYEEGRAIHRERPRHNTPHHLYDPAKRGNLPMEAEKFRVARFALGFDRGQMASALGLKSPQYISDIECGRKTPSKTLVLLLESILNSPGLTDHDNARTEELAERFGWDTP